MTRTDTDTDPEAGIDLNCKAFHYDNGWYEIRETGNEDGWIRTDAPTLVEQ